MPRFKFQQNDFNPKFIISNIILLFSTHYIINIFFTILFNSFFRTKLHINQIFSDEAIDLSSKYGYCYLCSLFFTNFFMIAGFVFIVDKAKKILDYVLTDFFIHLVLCTINCGFPSKFLWWVVNLTFVFLITIISEYISLKIEQKEIKLDFSITKKPKIKD